MIKFNVPSFESLNIMMNCILFFIFGCQIQCSIKLNVASFSFLMSFSFMWFFFIEPLLFQIHSILSLAENENGKLQTCYVELTKYMFIRQNTYFVFGWMWQLKNACVMMSWQNTCLFLTDFKFLIK